MTAPRRVKAPTPIPDNAADAWVAILQGVPGGLRQPEVLDDYTPAIRQLHAMSLLAAEVNNGGFSQFFFNGGGMWVDDAIAGFAAAGLDDHRQLTVDATNAVIANMDALVEAQRGSKEGYADWSTKAGLDQYDDRWWELPDVDPALNRFLADHAREIWERA
jgi:uncharacterized protein DUF4375